ncbi:unnamed protein product [Paramecium sonneborni]|uniref:Uncharacterized protein n=1 Tax=Paramecium sonneborni TaxID=65129 RepID=A0A8S1R0S1_9CILI|nr:unnamed protein product [Paramecium sonneborni]
MQISPLKKKINTSLNTPRETRSSIQDIITNQTEQIIKNNQLEQELHRVNQQRKLLSLELDDARNKYYEISQALQECELENALLRKQVQTHRQQEDISKLHILLQKTKSYWNGLKNLKSWRRGWQMKLNWNNKLKERNQYYQQFMRITSAFQKLECKNKQLESEKNQYQSELINLKQECQHLKEKLNQNESYVDKKNKWKTRYRDLLKEFQEYQSEKSSQKIVEQLQAEIDNNSCDEKQQTIIQNNDNEELNDIKDKLQQLEQENEYLREQNIELRNEIQSATDKLLKQQLQSSMIKEQSQTFSFVQYHQEYCDSLEEQHKQD